MSAICPPFEFKVEDLIKDGRTTFLKIEEIKNWQLETGSVPYMSSEQISLFLMACNNNLEQTKKTLQSYFKYKSGAPEVFFNRNLEDKDVQEGFRVMKLTVFPKKTKEGYRVIMAKLRDTRFSYFNVMWELKAAFMLLDVAVHKDPPTGLVIIIDIKGVGLMHLTRLKLNAVKLFCQFLQEALPAQLKGFYILNSNYILDKALIICKPFMSRDLYNMITPHSESSAMDLFFEKYISADCMPEDYGGGLDDLETLCCNSQTELKKLNRYFELDQKQTELYKNC